MRAKVWIGMIVALYVGALAVGCASARSGARKGAVLFSHLAHDVEVTEGQVYHGGGYDKATHLKIQQRIRKVLVAASAYDTAVSSWKEGATVPDAIAQSQRALNDALAELAQAVPSVASVQGPMNRVINAMKAALGTQALDHRLSAVHLAEMPGAMGVFALISALAGAFQSGKATVADFVAWLRSRGVTDEELGAAKALVDADIAAIDAEARAEANPPDSAT